MGFLKTNRTPNTIYIDSFTKIEQLQNNLVRLVLTCNATLCD